MTDVIKQELADQVMSEEMKLDLIKIAISSVQGWRNLALAVGQDPERKVSLVGYLRKLAGDKEVDLPVNLEDESPTTFPKEVAFSTMKVSFADLLVQQLEHHLALVNMDKGE